MPKTVTVELYEYDELTPAAQAKAREWWQDCRLEHTEDFDYTIEDADRMAAIMGLQIDRRSVPLHGGGTRQDPAIYWQLGYMQSDGVWIEGSYAYAKGAHLKIRQECPASGKPGDDQNARLHTIADRLRDLQKAYGYQLTATYKDNDRGPLQLELEHPTKSVSEDAYDEFRDIIRDFERWIYDQLRAEDAYQSEDATVAENIRANEYTFRADGRRSDG